MSDTVKIKSSHPSQGDFIVINATEFDENKHELFEGDILSQAASMDSENTGTQTPVAEGTEGEGTPILAEENEVMAGEATLTGTEGVGAPVKAPWVKSE